ncbi:hypothetical protein [Candidatus Uabimicrobium amorphum]|uniref:Uncharacterized protein n=1 Tax=Uabimicrobium amorphum TaxID=2596890 RepID=A0A5S9F2N1_UABAM|nr:hypothetical protein [Candidatus Uabimicrobium amorphum]BBM82302.1 hypothetical protein UABAM_00645 [Candidatus Uabimicrobium amorphum]
MYDTKMDMVMENCRVALQKDQENGNKIDGYLKIDEPYIEEDDLKTFFSAYENLLQNGVVVWGHLIQANFELYSSGKCDRPGEVVYCKNPLLRCDVGRLEWIAAEIFNLKGTTPEDPSLKEIADYLTDGYIRVFGLPVPPAISRKDIYQISTVYFARHHLPNKKLSGSVFPVIIDKDNPRVAMVLPHKYWPRDFLDHWNKQKNNHTTQPKKPKTPKILHLSFYNTVFMTLLAIGLLFFFVIPTAYMKFFPLQKMTCGEFFDTDKKPLAVDFSDGSLDYTKAVTIDDNMYVPVRAQQKKHKFIRVVIEFSKDADRKKIGARGVQEFYTDPKLQQQVSHEISIRHGVRVKDLLVLTTVETDKRLLWILIAVFVIACILSPLNIVRYIGMFRSGSYDDHSHGQLTKAGLLILFASLVAFFITFSSLYTRYKHGETIEKNCGDFYKDREDLINVSIKDCIVDYNKTVHLDHQIVVPVFPKNMQNEEMRIFLILGEWKKKNRARKYLHLKNKGKKIRLLTNYKAIKGMVSEDKGHEKILAEMRNKGKVGENYTFIEEGKKLPSTFFVVSRGILAIICLILGLWICTKVGDDE